MAEKPLVTLDGGTGESGGQMLRTALALSLARGVGFEMRNIRARRPRPGLRPEHVAAVRGAALASDAKVHGGFDGSQELHFEPGPLSPGDFTLDVPSTGSACLVLQALLPPLALAGGVSRIRITEGVTHGPASPSAHYLVHHWTKAVAVMGYQTEIALIRTGFHPRGNGAMEAMVRPLADARYLSFESRGRLRRILGFAGAGRIKTNIAGRLREAASRRLWEVLRLEVEWSVEELLSASPGSHLLLAAEFETGRAAFAVLGERGTRPELLGDRLARTLLRFLEGESAVDPHLADQLIVPMALCGRGGRLTTSEVTGHLVTMVEVLERFGCVASLSGRRGGPGAIEVQAAP